MNNAAPATRPSNSLPLFQYDSPKDGRKEYGAITVDGLFFHKIDNWNGFFAALGCDKDALQKGALPDELIWERYTREGAPMSKHCLQLHISNYLHENSDRFADLFGDVYALMLGSCSSTGKSNDRHCTNCPMHPAFCDSVTNTELDELFFVDNELRTDASKRFFGSISNRLLMKGLLKKFGTSVRLTQSGKEKIRLAINGGDTKHASRMAGSSND